MQVHIDVSVWPSEEGYVTTSYSAALGSTRYANVNQALQAYAHKETRHLVRSRSFQNVLDELYLLCREEEVGEIGTSPLPLSFQFSLSSRRDYTIKCNKLVSIGRLRTSYPKRQSHWSTPQSMHLVIETTIWLAETLIDIYQLRHLIGWSILWRH